MKGTGRHRAKRSLGQNFLVDQGIAARIISAISPSPDDLVIEIGPGLGALTAALVDSGADVIAIELDADLFGDLREKFLGRKNFRLIESDALEVDYANIVKGQAKLAANLPYNISTAILQKLSEQSGRFSNLVVMLQKEVVERITARPGKSERGFLTVLLESCFESRKLFDVPPTAFRPQPRVTSSVLCLTPRQIDIDDPAAFRRLLSSAFSQKRKTILNNLRSVYPAAAEKLATAGIDAARRAESLSLDEWLRLHGRLADR